MAGNLPPPAPALLGHANGATYTGGMPLRAPLLEWQAVSDIDGTGSPVSYTVRVATDAAMTDIVYLAEEIDVPAHQVPLSAGLLNSTTYYWDVEAIDAYGASADRDGNGNWSPSAPWSFTTENPGNNIYGVIHGAIRGLTVSNQVITNLTAASIAQTNNTALFEAANCQNGNCVYTVWALPGSVNLRANAANFNPKNKSLSGIQADGDYTENFLLNAQVVQVTIRVNNNNALHTNHKGTSGLPDDNVPVVGFGGYGRYTTEIQASSVRFGIGQALDKNGSANYSQVNSGVDSYLDARFDFAMSATDIACNDTEVTLTGQTTGGVSFSGTDDITTDCDAQCH